MAQVFDIRDRGAARDPLAARLAREIEGEVRFDAATRGRYSTDASIYQIVPQGVVLPKSVADVEAALAIAREQGISVIARGGGTSQAGQTVGRGLVIDNSKYLDRTDEFDPDGRSIWVEPGVVLDDLNRHLKASGLWFPVDISTSSRATIGGMAANNSCGSRSLRYGIMADNVLAIEGLLADGERVTFDQVQGNLHEVDGSRHYLAIIQKLRAIAAGNADDIRERFARLTRRVGGYNLDSIDPAGHNMARLVVGSEGTLAYFTKIKLLLQPLPRHKVLGVCHFPSFREAMTAPQHIVKLGPTAVELVDRSILDLAEAIPAFRELLPKFVRGRPAALLVVEFAGDELEPQLVALARLEELMADLGLSGSVVRTLEPAAQAEVWDIRTAGLNIAMSMKGDGKPVSFIEDCAVPLANLTDYTERLSAVFAQHGTRATWYAHASEGCLHVRPILNLKQEQGVRVMREIAEAAFAMVREYKGSHSGEHGDGLVRSDFHEKMFGKRLVRAFEEVKDSFDPQGLLNPGKIVRAPRMDDRSLLRYPPGYGAMPLDTALDWSAWGGFLGATEMCNNNGACRKAAGGVMCPSFRLTDDEQHVTRGRANTLRLVLSGQLGAEALTSDAMYETLELCVSCKACRRECPTGVDMARMKIEVLHQRARRHGVTRRQRLVAWLPRYAPYVARVAPLANLRNRWRWAARAGERLLGLSARRSLPPWRRRPYRPAGDGGPDERAVVLFADTFNTWFEPENAEAAERVLAAAGFRVVSATPPGERPLCCGRTFLAAGLVEEARAELRRTLTSLTPWLERSVPVVGLEPSCLFTFRDELAAILPGAPADLLAGQAFLLEEFLARDTNAAGLQPRLRKAPWDKALLHGHCHQKAFGAMSAAQTTLRLVPGLQVETIESSCCGMAGAFGYEAEHYDASIGMAERDLLPAVRRAAADAVIVADGTSCRHQIMDGAGREAVHVARVLAAALAGGDLPQRSA
ncbi:MAG TPA: FAD-linked oxidase C-terminal domain-containing protein [Geminicoccaceae bacterium]|nr:FAD-linked oxidase C-terminal domain-containing protein [Geminicoccaceae bacterium]